MSISKIFDWFLKESEEEIKADIKEAEDIIKERKKQLAELKKNKTKKTKSKKPINKKAIILPLIAIIIIGVLGFSYINYSQDFSYNCTKPNPCKNCSVIASCVQFEHLNESNDYLHFEITNKLDQEVECTAKIETTKEGLILNTENYNLGPFQPQETKHFKMVMTLPEGQSEVKVDPTCK